MVERIARRLSATASSGRIAPHDSSPALPASAARGVPFRRHAWEQIASARLRDLANIDLVVGADCNHRDLMEVPAI
jgi:hypothetical protein